MSVAMNDGSRNGKTVPVGVVTVVLVTAGAPERWIAMFRGFRARDAMRETSVRRLRSLIVSTRD